jgi:hypothetical protein
MLSFEAQQFQGTASIIEKLAVRLFPSLLPLFSLLTLSSAQGLPFTTIQHRVSTMDAQPAATDKASMIVLVTGQLIVRFSSSLSFL